MVEQSLLNDTDVSGARLLAKSGVPRLRFKLPISFHWFGAILGVVDVATILALATAAANVSGAWMRNDSPEESSLTIVGLFSALLFSLIKQNRRLYRVESVVRRRRPWVVLRIWLMVVATIATLAFITGHQGDHLRSSAICFFVAGTIVLPATWALAERILVLLIENDLLESRRKVVVFGQLTTMHAARTLANLKKYGFDVVGRVGSSDASQCDTHVHQIVGFARNNRVDEILLILDASSRGAIRNIVQSLQVLPIPVRLLLDDQTDWLLSLPACDHGVGRSVELQGRPMTFSARLAKRSFDLSIASLSLVLLAPLFLIVGLAIWADSRGPIIFRQKRAGFSGRTFNIYKFRSMSSLDDGATIQQATRDDARVTRVGRFIRRTSIDELPQLINVIRGEMSVVGPRPHALAHDDQYTQAIKYYARRYRMKPGITGWAQVNGCRGETPHLAAMEMRVRYDIWYITHWSLMLDILAVARTAWQIVFSRDAY